MLLTLLAAAGIAMTPTNALHDVTQESPADKDARMKWFREARFGMFIHWGLYAIPAGVWKGKNYPGASEWLLNTAQIKLADYLPLLEQFNPVEFDAVEWARIAKRAGVKYVVITSKHHDGFALYPSRVSQWHVGSSPFKRDILKELSEACRKEGIMFCTYHSIMDWHHPDYIPRRGWDPRPEAKPDFDRYVRYMKAQLKEIVENYKPAIMWFDGEWEDSWTHERGVDLYHYVRSLDPKILVNNRVDKGRAGMAGMTVGDHLGDFGTPEQEIPANGFPGVDWESCMTMNESWGFHQNDHNWKSARKLIENLVDCASKGGNYLLNVGPTALGKIPPESVDRLAAVGEWLKVNGEAIYGSGAGPFPRAPKWGRVTSKPGKLYLHVFDAKAMDLDLAGLHADIRGARLLGESGKVEVTRQNGALAVRLPSGLADKMVPVVVLEVEGKTRFDPPGIKAKPNGIFELLAQDATIDGKTAVYESDKDCIGYWSDPKDQVYWWMDVAKPGTFRVVVEMACEPEVAGTTFEVVVGSSKVQGTMPKTEGWDDFVEVELGTVSIPSAGKVELRVKPIKMPDRAVGNLRSVKLRPVG